MTVRLHTDRQKLESSESDCGEKERKYTDEGMRKAKGISDFLPSPEDLALKDETLKTTIAQGPAHHHGPFFILQTD